MLALLRLDAEVVAVVLRECAQCRQNHLANRRGEIHLFRYGHKRDIVRRQPIERLQGNAEVAREAVEFVHDDDVEEAGLSVAEHRGELRAFREIDSPCTSPLVSILPKDRPAVRLAVRDTCPRLGVKAVAFDLFLATHPKLQRRSRHARAGRSRSTHSTSSDVNRCVAFVSLLPCRTAPRPYILLQCSLCIPSIRCPPCFPGISLQARVSS